MNALIEKKRAVIEEVRQVLGEHFESYALIAVVADDDPKTDDARATYSTWGGAGASFNTALGLAHRLVSRLTQDAHDTDFPREDILDDEQT